MTCGIPLRQDYNAARLRDLAKYCKDEHKKLRLLAIAAIYDGESQSDAARIGNMKPGALLKWAVRFYANGPDGLTKRVGAGRRIVGGKIFKPINYLEERILEDAVDGVAFKLGDGSVPSEASDGNWIRGELVRFIALGGNDTHQIHPRGVDIQGVWIDALKPMSGPTDPKAKEPPHAKNPVSIDLEYVRDSLAISLVNCHIDGWVSLAHAKIKRVDLSGSRIRGNLVVHKDDNSTTEYETDVLQWDDTDETYKRYALVADRLETDAVVLSGCSFGGSIRLRGANLYGALYCDDISFFGLNACEKMLPIFDLELMGIQVGGRLFIRRNEKNTTQSNHPIQEAKYIRLINGQGAKFGAIQDNRKFWETTQYIYMDGCRYRRFAGDVSSREKCWWQNVYFGKKHPNDSVFRPQPYEQLASALSTAGYDKTALQILHLKSRAQSRKSLPIKKRILRFSHITWLFNLVTGYGTKPFRPICIMFAMNIGMAILYICAGENGIMSPTNPLVYKFPDASNYCVDTSDPAKERAANSQKSKGRDGDKRIWTYSNWRETIPSCKPPVEYTPFWPIAYSFDVGFPVLDLGQQNAWAPTPRGRGWSIDFGMVTLFFQYLQAFIGWFLSIMTVSALSGFFRQPTKLN